MPSVNVAAVHRLQQQQKPAPKQKCHRCQGGGHAASTCRFRVFTFRSCGKKGHIARACRSTALLAMQRHKAHCVQESDEDIMDDENEQRVHTIHRLGAQKERPLMVEVTVDKKTVPMEIDTGASVSILSESTFRHNWSRRSAPHPRITLRIYTSERIQLLGELDVAVRYDGQVAKLPILVVKENGPNLLGRDWVHKLKLDWTNICKVCGHTYGRAQPGD